MSANRLVTGMSEKDPVVQPKVPTKVYSLCQNLILWYNPMYPHEYIYVRNSLCSTTQCTHMGICMLEIDSVVQPNVPIKVYLC